MPTQRQRILIALRETPELRRVVSLLRAAGHEARFVAHAELDDAAGALVVLEPSEGVQLASAPGRPMVIAVCEPGDEARVLARGAEDVVSRPLVPELLAARIGARLRSLERIEALRRECEALSELAITDALTGLYNRRHFQRRLGEEFRRAQRHEQTLSLLLIDLDHFKSVNDTHGHAAGDAVLRSVSALLRRHVRDTDVLARYGGEEFAVLLPHTSRAGADAVARRIARALEESVCVVDDSVALRVTASIGVAQLPAPGVDSAESLVAVADRALYQAKDAGRNQVALAPTHRRPRSGSWRTGRH